MNKTIILIITFILLLVSSTYAVYDNSIIAYYPFDVNVNDTSSNTYDWTNTNMKFGSTPQCKVSGCIWGTEAAPNTYISGVNIPNVDTTYTKVLIMGWVYFNNTDAIVSSDRIFQLYYDNNIYYDRALADGKISFGCRDSVGFSIIQSKTAIGKGWHHLAYYWRDDTDEFSIYINGSHQGTLFTCNDMRDANTLDAMLTSSTATVYDSDIMFDEWVIMNTTDKSFINKTFNNGAGCNLITGGCDATPSTNLEVTLVYPTNGTHYNSVNPFNGSKELNFTGFKTTTNLNANCTIVRNGNYSQLWGNVTTSTTTQNYIYQIVGIPPVPPPPQGNYSMTVTCTNVVNTTSIDFWFVLDNIDPLIYINFVNNTIQANPFNLSVSYFDLYLYRTNTTIIRMSDNFTIYNNFSGDLGYAIETYNVSYDLNLLNSTYIVGDYIKIITNAVDTHTAKKFTEKPKTTELNIFDKTIKDYKLDYGTVRFEYPKDISVNEEYGFDRMNFKIKLDEKQIKKGEKINKATYKTIEADKIIYFENSEYPCHMIIDDKYWYDCVGMKEPKVSKESNNKYKIDFIMDSEIVITKSLGGLNEIYEEYIFKINKNYIGNIVEGDFFNPVDKDFNYTANQNFTVSSLLLDEDCITITGSNVSGFSKKYCYNLDGIEMEDVVLFAGATDVDCYINLSNSSGQILQPYFNWLNSTSNTIKTGFNLCDSGTVCTLDTLQGSLIMPSDSITCQMFLSDSWFNFSENSNTLSTSEVGLCDNVTLLYPIANFSYFDELTNDVLNLSASYDLTFFEGTSTFSIQNNNTGTFTEFCTDVNPTISVFNLKLYDTIILSKTGYITRVFNIPFSQGLEVSNHPYYNYSYYLIQVANSTTITYTWKNTDYNTLNGIMQIYRCENDGTRTLIESTNVAGGKATANLQLYSTPYSYSFIDNKGTTYTEPQYYSCHIESTQEQTYYVDVSQVNVLPVIGLFLMDCHIYNISSTIVKMEWDGNNEDATDIEACIVAFREDIYGRTQVYKSCVNESSGSLTRNVALTGFNYYVQGTLEQNGVKGYCQDEVVFNQRGTTSTSLGITGIFLAAILILSLALLFAGDNDLVILGGVVGLLVVWFIGIVSFSWITVSSLILLGVIIAVVGRYTIRR